MVAFGASYTIRTSQWTAFKSLVASKVLLVQYEDTGLVYTIWGYDGPEVHTCTIWKVTIPDSVVGNYSQATNDADKTDFETYYKPTANRSIVLRTSDGRQAVRETTANRTTNFNLRCVSFMTAKGGSLHNMNPISNSDYGDATYKLYNAAGSEVSGSIPQLTAVKTVIDWTPIYNYEIIGGYMDVPTDLMGGSTDDWFLSVIGVPDYTPAQGGQVVYVNEMNIEAAQTGRIISDGRAVSYLAYQYGGAPNTNRLRFIVKHPAGIQKRFQVYLEHFT